MESSKKFDKIKYNNEFNAQAYDRVNLTIPKGNKAQLQDIAESIGESVNTFINKAIEDRIKKEFPHVEYIFKYSDN